MHTATLGEAIRLIHEHSGRIDLLMTDVLMLEMNGRHLARILLPSYPDIQRFFLSDHAAASLPTMAHSMKVCVIFHPETLPDERIGGEDERCVGRLTG